MKYFQEDIANISWHEWNALMAKELNDAGFSRVWKGVTIPFKAHIESPSSFILGQVTSVQAIEHLKIIGLLNNGRCPMCGELFHKNPGRYTSGFDHNLHFQICQNCARSRGRIKNVSEKKSIIQTILSLLGTIILGILAIIFRIIGIAIRLTLGIISLPIRIITSIFR